MTRDRSDRSAQLAASSRRSGEAQVTLRCKHMHWSHVRKDVCHDNYIASFSYVICQVSYCNDLEIITLSHTRRSALQQEAAFRWQPVLCCQLYAYLLYTAATLKNMKPQLLTTACSAPPKHSSNSVVTSTSQCTSRLSSQLALYTLDLHPFFSTLSQPITFPQRLLTKIHLQQQILAAIPSLHS